MAEITDALLFVCDEAACKQDHRFYEAIEMDYRWAIIRAVLEAAAEHDRNSPC